MYRLGSTNIVRSSNFLRNALMRSKYFCISFPQPFERICGKFDGVQLMALREFLPNNDEKAGLQQYIQSASKSEETKKEAMKLLCVCERYMVAMMDVTSVSEKFDCLIFANQFEPDTESILGSINILMKACDDVQTSPRFRKLMGMILMLGNKINTGGSGKEAAGFTIDTLLKLEEVSNHLINNFKFNIFHVL